MRDSSFIRMSIHVPRALMAAASELAEKKGISRAELIRRLLIEALDKEKRKD